MIKIEDELKNDFLDYATEVNNNRSFADARDGLKPVQRAILWDMYINKYFSSKPHVKCAKISGSVIGHLHPHGDGAVYEALVRMSQDWVYHKNILPIDFHGANGSVIAGNSPASSRYTECRLSNFSEENFFKSIDKNIVNMIDNFSEDEKWPEVFPSITPMLLLSQVSGIGYTIANDWLPHNLCEVVEKVKEYISKNKITVDNIYPDYPTGGIIINKSDLHTIYETGKGSVILRGKASINDKYISITELPYQVYAEPFIQKIKDLVNSGTIQGIEDICNKSDDNGLLIEIECSTDPSYILQRLYKLTDLQCTFSANQMALVNGIPELLNLEKYIKVYIEHNINCIIREYQYDLDKATNRLEIVEGLLKAISIIDDVISTIKKAKSAESAKSDLIKSFGFSDIQAKAIIDMRLGKLANIEQSELTKEQTELNKIISSCTKLLASQTLQQKEFLKRLDDFVSKYGWNRRTEVIDVDLSTEKEISKTAAKQKEEFMIILTKDNHIKRVQLSLYKTQKNASNEINTIKIPSGERIILISDTGKMYKLDINKINKCTQNAIGTSLDELLNDRIIAMFSGNEEIENMIFITQNGLIKKINTKDVFSISKKIGTTVMTVDNFDKIVFCKLLKNEASILLRAGRRKKKISINELLSKGRAARGTRAIQLKEDNLEIIE